MHLPPKIGESTEQERREYVLQQWECMHNCELCGKCKVLRGRDVEELYAPYIKGECSYVDATVRLREM